MSVSPQSLPGRDEVDHLIVALLREEDPDCPRGDVGAIATSLCIRSRQHGVVSLMAGRLASRNDWPIEVREALQLEAISTSFWELRHQEILAETISMMRSRAIEPVLFKGTALAYSHYPSPHLRRRGDTDMIVAPGDVIKAAAALEELGFIRSGGISGDVVSYQDSYAKDVDVTGAHAIDLHRRFNNSELISNLFTYAELRSSAVPIPGLCPGALAADPVRALLISCVHRAVHAAVPYYVDDVQLLDADRLIWLYDIHLQAGGLDRRQWNSLVSLARAKGLARISRDGLERAEKLFGTEIPAIVKDQLAVSGEPVAYYLAAGSLERSWIDFRAVPGLRRKVRLIREMVFPPAAYMRARFEEPRPVLLPWLYARRLLGGAARRLTMSR